MFHHQATWFWGIWRENNFLVSIFLLYFPLECWMQQQKRIKKYLCTQILQKQPFLQVSQEWLSEGPYPWLASWDTFGLSEPHL